MGGAEEQRAGGASLGPHWCDVDDDRDTRFGDRAGERAQVAEHAAGGAQLDDQHICVGCLSELERAA